MRMEDLIDNLATVPRSRGQRWTGLRSRASVVLLAVLLLVILVLSALTIKWAQVQRAVLEDTIRVSQAQAIALLANRVEQTLLSTLRTPFLALKNIPPLSVEAQRLALTKEAFPEVEQVLFLDAQMYLHSSFPPALTQQQRQLNHWLAQRTRLEGIDTQAGDFILHIFVETIDRQPSLFAVQRVSERDRSAGWILIRYNLAVLTRRLVAPLLAEFNAKQGGVVQLQDNEAAWDDEALNWPVGRALPGWMLMFKPSPQGEAQRLSRESTLVWGVTAGVIVTLLMATFTVWRELRREHALVDLRNRFVANVSHELKTPLALIRMYAETLYLHRVTDAERVHEYLGVLLHESERLTQMINTVLDFSRLSQGAPLYQLTDTDLRATVREVLDSYRWRVEDQGLQLEVVLDETVPTVAHDRYGVTQILLNLIDNSVKYGAAGGVVRVSLQARTEGVELAVSDRGPGIPEGEWARLRKPFERGGGADSASGSGLGLALVDEIAKIHRASFKLATAAQGVGVQATVIFPVHAAKE